MYSKWSRRSFVTWQKAVVISAPVFRLVAELEQALDQLHIISEFDKDGLVLRMKEMEPGGWLKGSGRQRSAQR